jgi:glycosyltransferase involved in cell wall biosynthesis
MEHSSPRISIVCPIWNVAPFIAQTIESILAQTYKDWELVVMDGASTDGTADIVRTYASKDDRIKLTSEPDEGPWHALDKGIDAASGEFMTIICGQDGFLDNEWLAKCIRILDEDPAVALVWGPSREMSEDGALLSEDHVSHSHLMKHENGFVILRHIIQKAFQVVRDILFAPLARKKILIKKLFSKTARFKYSFLANRSFPGGKAPQKEAWFAYWLETGVLFNDQGAVLPKSLYRELAPRYPLGSHMTNHMTDLAYNMNTKGYLSRYIPTYGMFGRVHSGNSGETRAEEMYHEAEKYLEKVLAFRAAIKRGDAYPVFRDRNGIPISKEAPAR